MNPNAFDQYKRQVNEFRPNEGAANDQWLEVYDWYQNNDGRNLFICAFKHETGITVDPLRDSDERIGAALPKSINDYDNKVKNDTYYRAMAEMFIMEMDHIVSRVPRESDDPAAGFKFSNVQRLVYKLMLESVVLFEHWGSRCANVLGVFGAGMSEATHLVNFFHGAKQTIYGHGSFELSFSDNHSELAVATIRQAVEIRLRRAFGLFGKESVHDGSFHPVPISKLLEVMKKNKADVGTPVPFHNLVRIYNWANLILHSGIRHYAWTTPRVLDYLRPFLVGGDNTNGRISVHSGVRIKRASFDAIRRDLKSNIESTRNASDPRFNAILVEPSNCDVILDCNSSASTQ